MNKQPASKILAMLFLLSITGAFNVQGLTDGNNLIPKEISEYQSWLKVTPKPHEVKLNLSDIDGISD